jgi:hypothetical protein
MLWYITIRYIRPVMTAILSNTFPHFLVGHPFDNQFLISVLETVRPQSVHTADLEVTNPNAPTKSNKRTPQELIAISEEARKDIDEGLKAIKKTME